MNRDQELWYNARTLEDVGELTAQWLEGTIRLQAADSATEPAAETRELIPYLARYNRAGYVTDRSQPARELRDGNGQSAYVSGFCAPEIVHKIRKACKGTDILLLPTADCRQGFFFDFEITRVKGRAVTWAGAVMTPADLDLYYGPVCPNALDALKAAWQLKIVDIHWGRADVLWERIDAALK